MENETFWLDAVPFDGTVGVGCGPLADRPVTCTAGVVYWATSQSCSNLASLVGHNPATPIAGTLYKCTATDTWAAHFTPLAYPHPLVAAVAPGDAGVLTDGPVIATDSSSQLRDAAPPPADSTPGTDGKIKDSATIVDGRGGDRSRPVSAGDANRSPPSEGCGCGLGSHAPPRSGVLLWAWLVLLWGWHARRRSGPM